jgi:hypothetical protein
MAQTVVKQNQWIGPCFVMLCTKFKSIEVVIKIIKIKNHTHDNQWNLFIQYLITR